jgi:hypothetical protein
MPTLPKNNRLDYNPDSVILASKMLNKTARENLKNPLQDPDFAALRSVKLDKGLSSAVSELNDLALQAEQIFLKIVRVGEEMEGAGRMRGGGPKEDKEKKVKKPVGRPPKSSKLVRDPEQMSVMEQFYRTQSGVESGRFGKMAADEFNKRREASGAVAYPAEEGEDFDEETKQEDETAHRNPYDQDIENIRMDQEEEDADNLEEVIDFRHPSELEWQKMNLKPRGPTDLEMAVKYFAGKPEDEILNLVNLITSIFRKMDVIVTTKLKSHIQQLTPNELNKLSSEIYEGFLSSFKKFITTGKGSVIFSRLTDNRVKSGSFGMVALMIKELETLMMDLLVVIKSYRQNFPDGSATADKLFTAPSGGEVMEGSGRNFYDQAINDSPDIPTIWGKYRNCATKYLL